MRKDFLVFIVFSILKDPQADFQSRTFALRFIIAMGGFLVVINGNYFRLMTS